MRENVYIQGLNRHARFFGLPLPLAALAFLPPFLAFIILDSLWYLWAIPLLWTAFWAASLINPHFARFIGVVMMLTPERVLRVSSGSRYE